MTVLLVPKDDGIKYPTLGPLIAKYIEDNLVFGPGSLQGEPAKLDDEKYGLLCAAYQLYPQGHEFEGMRRHHRVAWELRKGRAKTEFAAWVTACELSPDAPVRFDGWDKNGNPYGRPVNAPFIPMMAAAEEQVQELAYGVLKWILEHSPNINSYFDIGLERIVRVGWDGTEDGVAMAVSNAPATRDGARTTFQHFDEPHRLHLPLQRQAHDTMTENLPKRMMEDPWSLYTSTAGSPGQGSIQEDIRAEAEKIDKGEKENNGFFFFSRWAGPEHNDLSTKELRIKAISDATGPCGEWGKGQFAFISSLYEVEGTDRAYWERVWLNRWRQGDASMFNMLKVQSLRGVEIPRDAFVVTGFDGARRKDSTALVVTDIDTGMQQLVGCWEYDENVPDWEVDQHDVSQTLADVRSRYEHWKMFGDPPYWTEQLADWAALYPDEIVEFWTNQQRRMAYTIRAYLEALESGACRIVGSDKQIDTLLRHMGNAGKKELNIVDDQGKPLYIMTHAEGRLADKYDAAMAGCLSWAACLEARRKGAERKPKIYVPRRLR
jgi:hypothetical protein